MKFLEMIKTAVNRHVSFTDQFSLQVSLPRPRNLVRMQGSWRVVIVTVQFPKQVVESLLPRGSGFELGAHQIEVRPDFYPVVFYFGQMFGAGFKLPLVPAVNYREQVIGIPHVYRRDGEGLRQGPFFFMPQLYLDHLTYTLGGWVVWGFNKRQAQFNTSETRESGRWSVISPRTNDRLISASWTNRDVDYQPADRAGAFARQKEIMQMAVISQQPLGTGPFFVRSDFQKNWTGDGDPARAAKFRPIQGSIDIGDQYMARLPAGEYAPGGGLALPRESFQFITDWTLTLPRPLACK